MKAKAGDRVVVDRHRPGDVERHGGILEVRGEKETPRYLVRWSDGRESIFVARCPSSCPSSPAP